MHEYGITNEWHITSLQDGIRKRERGNFLVAVLTYLANCYSYLTATIFVGSIQYGFHYIQHGFQAIVKVHILWLYRVLILSGPYHFLLATISHGPRLTHQAPQMWSVAQRLHVWSQSSFAMEIPWQLHVFLYDMYAKYWS